MDRQRPRQDRFRRSIEILIWSEFGAECGRSNVNAVEQSTSGFAILRNNDMYYEVILTFCRKRDPETRSQMNNFWEINEPRVVANVKTVNSEQLGGKHVLDENAGGSVGSDRIEVVLKSHQWQDIRSC